MDANASDGHREYVPREPIVIKPKTPKGAKKYFFNEHGTFLNEDANWNHTVFKCYARTDKAAVNKFNKWQHES
jgi:hypothetical protein